MSAIKNAIISELRSLTTVSKGLQATIAEAKTKTKKQYYTKKLRKNNNRVADLVMAVERINQREKIQVPSDEKAGE